jgi:hypothetical protein
MKNKTVGQYICSKFNYAATNVSHWGHVMVGLSKEKYRLSNLMIRTNRNKVVEKNKRLDLGKVILMCAAARLCSPSLTRDRAFSKDRHVVEKIFENAWEAVFNALKSGDMRVQKNTFCNMMLLPNVFIFLPILLITALEKVTAKAVAEVGFFDPLTVSQVILLPLYLSCRLLATAVNTVAAPFVSYEKLKKKSPFIATVCALLSTALITTVVVAATVHFFPVVATVVCAKLCVLAGVNTSILSAGTLITSATTAFSALYMGARCLFSSCSKRCLPNNQGDDNELKRQQSQPLISSGNQ